MTIELGHKSMLIECARCGHTRKLISERSFKDYNAHLELCKCTLPGLQTNWIVYPEEKHFGPEAVPGSPW